MNTLMLLFYEIMQLLVEKTNRYHHQYLDMPFCLTVQMAHGQRHSERLLIHATTVSQKINDKRFFDILRLPNWTPGSWQNHNKYFENCQMELFVCGWFYTWVRFRLSKSVTTTWEESQLFIRQATIGLAIMGNGIPFWMLKINVIISSVCCSTTLHKIMSFLLPLTLSKWARECHWHTALN
jgi:hypothetical protein